MAAARIEIDTVDALVQVSFATQRLLEQRAADSELSLIQARLLGILRDREPTMNELSVLLDLDKSSVSGLVDRAARRGLVSRVPSQDDRRSVRVRLEDAGRTQITEAVTAFEDDLQQMLAGLSPRDRETWTRLTAKLLVADATARGIRL